MSHPNPVVDDNSGVPEFEHESVRCGHLPQDDCECNGNDQPTAAVIEATGAARCCDPGPYCDDLPGCELKPGSSFEQDVAEHLTRLAAERSPVTPAEERTGVSDVMAAVATEVASLRAYVAAGSPFADPVVLRRLDRIALWIRGGAS